MHDSSAAHHDKTSNLYSRAPERCLRLQLLPGQKPAHAANNFMQKHFAYKEAEFAFISEHSSDRPGRRLLLIGQPSCFLRWE